MTKNANIDNWWDCENLMLTICSHFCNKIVVTKSYYILANTSTQESNLFYSRKSPSQGATDFFFLFLK